MWRCKHCHLDFDFDLDKSRRANHSRWCEYNPKRNEWNKSRGTILRYGEYKDFKVNCSTCGKQITVNEREKIFPSKTVYFCGRSCASKKGSETRWNKYGYSRYSTICFKHHPRSCIVCGFDRVIAVHHVNEDHNDNRPENLVPLCPNHHEMFHHSLYRNEIEQVIVKYVVDKWGCSSTGERFHGMEDA